MDHFHARKDCKMLCTKICEPYFARSYLWGRRTVFSIVTKTFERLFYFFLKGHISKCVLGVVKCRTRTRPERCCSAVVSTSIYTDSFQCYFYVLRMLGWYFRQCLYPKKITLVRLLYFLNIRHYCFVFIDHLFARHNPYKKLYL